MKIPEHGGNTYKFKIKLDFSANINPLGMPENVKKAAVDAIEKSSCYPDPDCSVLRRKLSVYERIPMENIVCGNGASDLIYRIIAAIKPKNALICAPTFSEYKKALIQNGCNVVEHRLSEDNYFGVTSEFADKITPKTDMIILCSPNNPNGEVVTPYTLSIIIDKCIHTNTLIVCDESFMDLVIGSGKYTVKRMINSNIIIIKAFTKTYAMAGLRLGYGIFGDAEMASKIRNTGQFWSVSVPALAAGEAAADEFAYVRISRKIINRERRFLMEKLTEMGLMVYPSKANFLLFRCELPLDKLLLKKGILIRNCSNFSGIEEDHYRIAVRTHKENIVLIEAIERILHV